MKRFLSFIVSFLVFLLWGCTSVKQATKSDVDISESVDSAAVSKKTEKEYIDTTRLSATSVKITKITFFDPERNAKEYADKPEEDEYSGLKGRSDHPKRLDRKPPPAMKSIEITEINHADQKNGRTDRSVSEEDSTSVNSKMDNETTTEKEIEVDSTQWKWFGRIAVASILFGLWLKVRKK